MLGAGGFIGRRVVAALAATDWAVPIAAIHRGAPPRDVDSVRLDATRRDELAPALARADGIVSCVAGDPATIVGAARALFEAAAALPRPPRVVHLSSMAVYGAASGVVDESAPLRGDLSPYAAAKVEAEALARSCPSVVHLRPGLVYGPASREWSDYVGRWLAARRLGDLGAAGRGCCDLVYVEDVAAAVLRALRQPDIDGQAFNLAPSACA